MKKKLKNTKNPKGVFPQVRVGVSKFLLIDTEILVFFFTYFVEIPLIAKIAFKVWKIGIFAIFVQFLLSGFKQNSINKKVKVTV